MGSLFSRPKSIKPPPVPPTPDTTGDPEEETRKRQRGRRGFRETIITGALAPETGKKRLLG